MLDNKFLEVLSKEGVAPIVSWCDNEAHVVATWNSYINITKDEKLLIPAAGMNVTQNNVSKNNRVKMVFGSKEVMGQRSMGAGFALEGVARFVDSGDDFDMMKAKFPFLNKVLEITISRLTQTL